MSRSPFALTGLFVLSLLGADSALAGNKVVQVIQREPFGCCGESAGLSGIVELGKARRIAVFARLGSDNDLGQPPRPTVEVDCFFELENIRLPDGNLGGPIQVLAARYTGNPRTGFEPRPDSPTGDASIPAAGERLRCIASCVDCVDQAELTSIEVFVHLIRKP